MVNANLAKKRKQSPASAKIVQQNKNNSGGKITD